MSSGVAGARVLLTGGSSGIGLLCAQRLSAGGAKLALVARGADGLAQAVRSLPAGTLTCRADVADAAALRLAVDAAVGDFGGLDGVVAVAGAAAYGPFSAMAEADYRRTIETTLLGVMNTAHLTLPHLERSGGVLVVVGSIAGRVPIPWLTAYTAAKHGVRGFVRAWDCELRARRSPVRAVLVAPGPVDTPFWRRARTTDGRMPPRLAGAYRPEDVAEEVLRAIADPARAERTVGGLMALAALIDSLAPNLSVRVLGLAGRLGWRAREAKPPSDADGLHGSVGEPHAHGGLASRPTVLGRLRRPGP